MFLSKGRRYLETLIFVAGWMALGLFLHPYLLQWLPSTDLFQNQAYLLLGVPLAIIFQRIVRAQPVVSAWVAEAKEFRLDRSGFLIAFLLVVIPIPFLYQKISEGNSGWILVGVICLIGSLPAAFAVRNFKKSKLKELLLCVAVAGTLGCLILFGRLYYSRQLTLVPSFSILILFFNYLVIQFNMSFIVEEVVFRGVLDSHLYRSGETGSWFSAIFLSVLWGLWHLPFFMFVGVQGGNLLAAGIFYAVNCAFIGVPMSLYWRRSGNLIVPAMAHVFIDAVSYLFIKV